MPHAPVNDIALYYAETGDGPPIVFSHEFAGDYRSWQPQVEAFSGTNRCITYSHRGYPPSRRAGGPRRLQQDLLVEDLRGLLDHLGIERAHRRALDGRRRRALETRIDLPGTLPDGGGRRVRRGRARAVRAPNNARVVQYLRTHAMAAFAEMYAAGAARLTFQRKDPPVGSCFAATGRAFGHRVCVTQAGIQRRRPTIFALGALE